jgi:PAS domain S-box-containing protein
MRGSSPTFDILRAAVDQAAGPIVIADALGRITYANGAVAALVGMTVERIRGRHFSSLVVSDAPIGDLEQIAARVAAGQTWSRPVLGRRRDGSRFHLDLLVSPVRDEHGAVTHSIALLRDVMEEREIADELASELRQ